MKDHTCCIENVDGKRRMRFAPVFNVAAAFLDHHRHVNQPQKIFLRTYEGETVTYGMLAQNVNRCGNVLQQTGIGRGERMLMVVKDGPEFPYLFWGAIKAGIIPVPLNTLLRQDDYRNLLEDSEATAIVYSPEFAAEVEPALRSARQKPPHVLRSDGDTNAVKALIPQAAPELPAVATTPDDDCFWLYSSGSTGKPKGAVHRHRSMAVVSQYVGVESLGFEADDVGFSTSKMFFAYGLGNSVTVPLWVGASSVVTAARPTPEVIFEVIETFKPSLFFGVPTLYAALLQALEQKSRDLSSLRLCVSSGEALPAELFRRWQERTGQPLIDVMGTTESCYCFITSRTDAYKPGYTGLLVPGHQAKIVDAHGQEVGPGEPGQLLIQSQAAAKYYWKNPEKTAQTMLGDGWLRTGDTCIQDANGFFQCQGRNDDMLKVGGIWCSPFEIEAKLIEHPKVLEAAVVGRLDPDHLIKPEAWLVLKEATDAGPDLAQDLLRLCKTGLAPYKYPRWFNFVEALPKTATGKIQRVKLRDGLVAPPVSVSDLAQP
jgi:benzoate-CoA ligase family protein